ncbi:hypothetical protein BU25DRAFT_411165 [Macroventuria anomochaeta]|uniref:Uncharacterized protein n=1 Tax=Macroventuria anomochaeta TaxID=301207 RepID=A0ACB6S1J7_9PLEO|nr:uncharacterized protein BU25DRAFT_411165 [Macroventuria anomochaeta]KAF2627069.1 hypothetical protein BU25DRAFT_411165 [Macroventuria anomochaeta]
MAGQVDNRRYAATGAIHQMCLCTSKLMRRQTVKVSQRHDGQFCNPMTLIGMLARGEEPTDDPIEVGAAALDVIRKMMGPIQAPDDSNGANDKSKDENTPRVDIMPSMLVELFQESDMNAPDRTGALGMYEQLANEGQLGDDEHVQILRNLLG